MSWADWGSLGLAAYSAYNAKESGDAAASANQASVNLGTEQLADARAAAARSEALYGTLEENMSEYYTNMTAKQKTEEGLDRYDTEFKAAQEATTASLAQRGLSGSGLEGEAIMSQNIQGASDRVNIRNLAESEVRSEQLGFLGVGMGQDNIATQNAANASSNLSSIYGGMSASSTAAASAAASGAGKLISGLMYSAGRGNSFGGVE